MFCVFHRFTLRFLPPPSNIPEPSRPIADWRCNHRSPLNSPVIFRFPMSLMLQLQERLNQIMMEKKKESRSGMEIMNLLQKEGRQRGTWNGKKADNDFYKKIVDAYEAKNQELVTENADLRALLRSMQVDMRDFLNAPNGSSKHSSPVRDADPSQSPLGWRTDVFELAFHMGRDQIQAFLRNKVASIKRYIEAYKCHWKMEMLLKLVAVFGPVIISTISAPPTVGVDLHAEKRILVNFLW
ncbi:hypothetical protein L1887_15147 [Cichorium endivia]|nr:hypothetical protein L1887_15147 [Cichorium endivia]